MLNKYRKQKTKHGYKSCKCNEFKCQNIAFTYTKFDYKAGSNLLLSYFDNNVHWAGFRSGRSVIGA